jgi:FtsZ-binding cell division protein ZapB
MPPSEATKLERLDLLENKVSQAAAAVETLTARCRELTKVNEQLRTEINDITSRNEDLAGQIEELKNGRGDGKVDDKEIIHRIDRMIEKFGELQV